jgi:hypothetical protein
LKKRFTIFASTKINFSDGDFNKSDESNFLFDGQLEFHLLIEFGHKIYGL